MATLNHTWCTFQQYQKREGANQGGSSHHGMSTELFPDQCRWGEIGRDLQSELNKVKMLAEHALKAALHHHNTTFWAAVGPKPRSTTDTRGPAFCLPV